MSPRAGLTRFYLGYVLTVMVITGVVGVQISRRVQHEAMRSFDDSLRDQAVLLRELATPALQGQMAPTLLQEKVDTLGRAIRMRLTVIREDGIVIADSRENPQRMDNHGQRQEIQEARDQGLGTSTRHSATLDQDMTYFALKVEQYGRPLGYVRTALPLTEVEKHLAGVRGVILLGAAVLSALSLIVGIYLLRGAMRPLSRRTAAAESEAAGGRRSLAAILGSMAEGVIAVDGEQRIVHVNAAAGRLFDVVPQTIMGAPGWKLLRQPEILECLERVLSTREEQALEFDLESPDKASSMRLELRVAPLRGESEARPVGAVLVFHDVTRLRHLEGVRQDFVANVSHEIKTPLAAAQGMVETMIDDPTMDEETQTRFLDRIQKQMERLGNLVNDLLALSRYEGDEVALVLEEIDVRHPVLEAVEQFRPYAETKTLSLGADVPTEPVLVEGDPEGLRQVFDNLLSNAIRYTPEGGRIELRVKAEGSECIAEVEDSGIGIEAKHLGRIFERFYRVDRARSRELGGTGLGLSIVKHILARMDGGVSVQSRVGVGTIFRIHLPLAQEAGEPGPDHPVG
jgi:two-component system phosphate regulon sensor histidine kinase PhoR